MPNSDSSVPADLPPPTFVCSITNVGLDAAWVHVAGELDIATVPRLEQVLRASHARLVVVDLRELDFMDCSGVRTLLDASVSARREGRRLVLVRGIPHVDRLFVLTGTTDEIEIGEFDPAHPPVEVLRQLAEAGRAS